MGVRKRFAQDSLAHHENVGQGCNSQWGSLGKITENQLLGPLDEIMAELDGPPVGLSPICTPPRRSSIRIAPNEIGIGTSSIHRRKP